MTRSRRRVGLIALAVLGLVPLSFAGSQTATADQNVSTFADHVADRFLRVDLGTGSATEGFLVFIDAEDGMFWPDEPVAIDPQVDGSIDVSFDGTGRQNSDVAFDSREWDIRLGDEIQAVDLQILGTVYAGGTTADFTVTVGLDTYILDDTAAPTGAAVLLTEVIDDLENGELEDVYAALHPTTQALVPELEFVASLEASFAEFGTISAVDTIGDLVSGDNGRGWDIASSDVDVDILKSGCTATYVSHVTLVYDGAWYVGELAPIEPDQTAPASEVQPLTRHTFGLTEDVPVPFTASDSESGICDVELWSRYRSPATAEWGEWELSDSSAASPFSLPPAGGPVEYQFYSVATDGAFNSEVAAASAQAGTVLLPNYSEVIAEGAPIHYWPLDETTGTTAVDEIGNADGTYLGSVDLSEEGPGPALPVGVSLDGVDDVISLPVDLGNGPWSIELWVRPWNQTDDPGLLFVGDETVSSAAWAIHADDGAYSMHSYPGDTLILENDPTMVQPGVWNLIVITRNVYEEEPNVYVMDTSLEVNGQQVESTSENTTDPVDTGASVTRIGFAGHATNYLQADVAGIAIYDYAVDSCCGQYLVGLPHQALYEFLVTNSSDHVWMLTETAGTIAHNLASGLRGVSTNGASLGAAGPSTAIPRSIDLDGTNDFVSVPDPDELLDVGDISWTMQAWIKGLSWTGGDKTIIGKGAGSARLYVDASGHLVLAKAGAGDIATSTITMDPNAWYHVAATKAYGEVVLYVNGVDVTGSVTSATIVATSDALGIGSATGEQAEDTFYGYIAGVTLSPDDLGPDDVAQHYAYGSD